MGVRSVVIVALVALAAVVGALVVLKKSDGGRRRPPPSESGDAEPGEPSEEPGSLPDVAARIRNFERAPASQQILADFVRACVERGAEAVPELAARLRNEPDIALQTRWSFDGDQLQGFPSLRSAYIAALVAIPGPEARDALIDTLDATSSTNEAFHIVAGLVERGDGGFTTAALEKAQRAGPGEMERARELVGMTAEADPAGTAAEIVALTPRAEDGRDPAMLARGLEVLPMERAAAAARTLCADPDVTPKAKERYLRSLCDRGEPELLAQLRQLAAEGLLDREMKIKLAYAAVNSNAFYLDKARFDVAAAGGDPVPQAEIREVYDRRLREVELIIEAAVPAEVEGAGPLLESLQRRLEEKRQVLR